jgi:predicted MFS family arabinose efflux permease
MTADAEPTATAGPAPPGAAPPAPPALAEARPLIAVIAAGIFVTGFGWPGIIGKLPFNLLLKNQLHLPAQDVAAFWAVATIAWYFKPLVGLICDAYPLQGTRRRGYMLWGSVLAAAFWLAFALVPRRYLAFMAVMTALNVSMVFVSTVVGGLQVEVSQRYQATGRLASMRQGLEGVMNLLGGPIGGMLAVQALGWTEITGGLIMLSFVPVVAFLYREPRGATRDAAVWVTARRQMKTILGSGPMWGATGLLFLVFLAPGLQTPQLYYQTDVLKLDPRFIGLLQLLGGVGVLVGSAIYGVVCRYVPLRWSLVVGIAVNALSSLFYLRYDSATSAAIIDSSNALLATLGILPVYDLAVRATPKGSESFGFALMMSIRNISIFAISDPVGSYLYGHYHVGFKSLVWINAASTFAVLLFVPLIPKVLLASRERSAAR